MRAFNNKDEWKLKKRQDRINSLLGNNSPYYNDVTDTQPTNNEMQSEETLGLSARYYKFFLVSSIVTYKQKFQHFIIRLLILKLCYFENNKYILKKMAVETKKCY